MQGLARETALLHVRALVVVHFFSGFRRMGDIHHILDHRTMETGAQVFTISVELCMQRVNGDLATPQASRWWRERVLAGQVVAAGGGPPCETFTVARQYEGGPRPLRDAAHPLGLPGLTLKEWAQLRISDRLLRFLLDVLVALALMHGNERLFGTSAISNVVHQRLPGEHLGHRSPHHSEEPGVLLRGELRSMHSWCPGEKTDHSPPAETAEGARQALGAWPQRSV